MLIYGYKGDKCLKSDNCNDYTSKNLIALKNYNIDLYNNSSWHYIDILLRHVCHTYTTLCKFNNSLVSTYEVNSNYIENIDFIKEYLEKNLDIEIDGEVPRTMKYYEKQEIFRKASINLKRNYQDFVV